MYVKLKLFVVLVLVTIIHSQTAKGQFYNFQTYSLAEGLPQSQVFSIMQDQRGNLWIGTNGGGAARFNGKSFQIFSKQDGLVNSQVRQILEDKNGNLWMASVFGVSRYDGKNFTNYTKKDGFVNSARQALLEDKKGRIWNFAQNPSGIHAKYFEDGKLVPYKLLNEDTTKTFRNYFYPYLNKDSLISICTPKGTFRLEDDKIVRDSLSQDIFKNKTNYPFFDNNRNFWVSSSDEGSVPPTKLYRWKDNKFILMPFPAEFIATFTNLWEDQKGRIWLASGGKGLAVYDGSEIKYFNTSNGLPQNTYTTIFEDNESNLWFGSITGGGLVKYSGERFTYFTDQNGLYDNKILSLMEDSKGNFWFGHNNRLSFYNGKELIKLPLIPNLGLVNKIFETKNNEILIATQRAGILEYKDDTLVSTTDKFKLPPTYAIDIFQDKDTLFFSTLGVGVHKYFNGDTTLLKVPNYSALGAGQVNHIMKDSKGTLWFSTAAGIINYIHENNVKVYTEDSTNLSSNLVLETVEDNAGNLWMVTYGGGVNKFDGEKFEVISTKKGLASDLVYSILKDDIGNLWIGTQNGLDKITLDQKGDIVSIKNYNKNQGFIGIENNRRASLKDAKGNLWFGTIGGVVKYNPTEDQLSQTAPIVNINNVKLNFRDVNWDSELYKPFNTGVSSWNNIPEKLSLPHHENHITFHFEALGFRSPEGLKYQWKLEGLEKEWSPSSIKTEAVYPGLSHGKYIFRVRAINSDGIISKEEASFSFVITPAFWQTNLFRLLFIGFILSATFTGVKIRIKSIEQRKKQLEKLVEIKTAEVVKQKDEIQEQNSELEKQKNEIQEQNAELEQQQDEILAQNEYIINQNNELQKKNHDITSSINYAKRIQQAMLPTMERIQKAIPESFILFKPRDIVSGDFYWFQEHEDKLIIAAVDCTGHGVPGAFMSMIGYSLLGQIVNEKNVTDAGKILTYLDAGIRDALKQKETENRDGMDIALTVIDKKEKTLEFAGAKNPLYYVNEGELKVIKGDKKSIGGVHKDRIKIFNSHKVNLNQLVASNGHQDYAEEASTTFYIFTDGYQDQFGGKNDRKFMSKRFRELLLDIHQKPMNEQKQILDNTIEDWMYTYKSEVKQVQVDDILVIGVKV